MERSDRAALIAPHAPALLLDAHDDLAAVGRLRTALDALDIAAGRVFVLSPHGPRTGVLSSVSGDLAGFGITGRRWEWPTDGDAASELARAWGQPRVEESADHGLVVPLALVNGEGLAVVGAALDEKLTAVEHAALGAAFGAALGTAFPEATLIVSINGSAGLSARAPLTELEGARAAEKAFVTALGDDLRSAALFAIGLEDHYGSCAAGGIAALAAFMPRARVVIDAYEAPFGVGYLVARTT